ncbi:MAG: helix-turn-helix transcriptional regulator [Elusimicrobia bacterium]|nr:helix-turn-helix transcriptional regulator [Elusimicrobiota bacterium]
MKKDIYETIGARIRQERKNAGLTLQKLAELADISVSFLSYIEANKKKASLNTVKKIADGLDVPLSAIFEEPRMETARNPVYEAKQKFGQIIRDKSKDEIYTILDLVKAGSKFVSSKTPGRKKSK